MAKTRTDCDARITLSINNGKFVIREFVEEHNHPLQLAETTHMLVSHCKISEVQTYEFEMAEDSGLRQKALFQLMSAHAGGRTNLGYTRLDAKNYLKARRQRSMVYGEVGSLMQYFQHQILENPSFYHAYQMDCDEQITNVFWVALLYDETVESFKWLFEIFLEAHGNKKPKTLFTDQDQAMAKALAEVMPETRHGLCVWHLMQNGIKHLGNLMKRGSHFLTDFKKCMYEYDQEVKFEAAWSKMVAEVNIYENNWVKSVYAIKEKWAACHMKEALTLGMRST